MKFFSLALLIGLALPSSAFARIELTFSLETCVWHATDIVVVEAGGEIDDHFLVAKTLLGELKIGEEIVVPELGAFRDKTARQIHTIVEGEEPRFVTGKRMILFLQKDSPEESSAEVKWQSANLLGRHRLPMQLSVAWIEDKQAFAINQTGLHERAGITSWQGGTAALFAEANKLIDQKAKFLKAESIEDATAKANAMFEFSIGDNYFVRRAAFEDLAECGPAAKPVLMKILANEKFARFHGDAISCLGKALDDKAAPLLVDILKTETAFWKKRAPDLSVGWWNGKDLNWGEVNKLRDRYGRLSASLRSMAENPQPQFVMPVTELRDFWRSLPQLEDKSGLNQISEEANEVLKMLRSIE